MTIVLPAAAPTGVMQDRVASPSISAVQAPQRLHAAGFLEMGARTFQGEAQYLGEAQHRALATSKSILGKGITALSERQEWAESTLWLKGGRERNSGRTIPVL